MLAVCRPVILDVSEGINVATFVEVLVSYLEMSAIRCSQGSALPFAARARPLLIPQI